MYNLYSTNTLISSQLDRADRAGAISNSGLSLPRNHARPRLMATPFWRKRS